MFGEQRLKKGAVEVGGVVMMDVADIALFEMSANIGQKIATPSDATFEEGEAKFGEA